MFEQFTNILSNEELNECKKIVKESLWKYSGSEQVENKTLTEIA
jgi:hypothetical protein